MFCGYIMKELEFSYKWNMDQRMCSVYLALSSHVVENRSQWGMIQSITDFILLSSLMIMVVLVIFECITNIVIEIMLIYIFIL